MSIELKIKSKHLALEPSIIRMEEKKLNNQVRYLIRNGVIPRSPYYYDSIWASSSTNASDMEKEYSRTLCKFNSLRLHRTRDVRFEARATFLARSYLAGKSYKSVEPRRKYTKEYDFNAYVMPRTAEMVYKYGPKVDRAKLPALLQVWVDAEE